MNIGTTGAKGEKLARKLLEQKGYKTVCTNFQTRFGELDIVCRNDEFIVFAEVKTRGERYMVSGRDSVGFSKQGKIIKAASQYLQQNPCELQPRFDVVEIVIGDKDVQIEHIENAFSAGGRHEFF